MNTTYTLECWRDGKLAYSLHHYGDKDYACWIAAGLVIAELGDGDGENGGAGSLENCKDDIFKCFKDGGAYYYADCIFKFITTNHFIQTLKTA